MLRAVGFGDGDFDKPIVGVANGHSTMNPCNAGIQPLVDRAMAALKEAGAMPQVFGFPTVTDGIGMGTEGMKYSLVSREVIADSVETVMHAERLDAIDLAGDDLALVVHGGERRERIAVELLDAEGNLVTNEYGGFPTMTTTPHVRLAIVTTAGGDINAITDDERRAVRGVLPKV